MQINKITFTPTLLINKSFNNNHANSQKEIKNQNSIQIKNFAYRDYKISFGERLFRSPENFYAQDFNKKYMPDTMTEYLNADYEDRQKMPPAQMMKLVFDDLNNIKNLDFVPRIFPNEPLFKDLTDTPKRNARTGLVSEYEALKSEMDDIPLFKDGTSNLGMYIVKKIYLEGKTLAEINKDFKKDLSNDYKDLISSEIDFATTSAYGIKFPKQPFWKSFVATREDFPYVYKPRKDKNGKPTTVRSTEKSISSINPKYDDKDKRPPKFSTKDFEKRGNRMGDALLGIIDSKKDEKGIRKALRHSGVTDESEISFIAKYFSQIMSIALEKTHASEEMHYYFENNSDLTKKQRQKMQGYWRENPFMREYQSLAISDTIKLFYEAYGADGNNDEFRDLLEYAAKIKPERLEKSTRHQQRQIELEEVFKNYTTNEDNMKAKELLTQNNQKPTVYTYIPTDKPNHNSKTYSFTLKDGSSYSITIADVIKEYCDKIKDDFKLLPDDLISKYTKYSLNSDLSSDEYRKIVVLYNNKVPEEIINEHLDIEKCRDISADINRVFGEKYPYHILAAEAALAERIVSRLGSQYAYILENNAINMLKFTDNKETLINNWTESERKLLNTSYRKYLEPIKDKNEIAQINKAMLEYLPLENTNSITTTKDENTDSTVTEDKNDIRRMNSICALIANTINEHSNIKNYLSKEIRYAKFIENYGGTSRMLLNPDIPEELKKVQAKKMLKSFISNKENTKTVVDIMSYDNQLIAKYMEEEPDLRLGLLRRNIHMHNNQM